MNLNVISLLNRYTSVKCRNEKQHALHSGIFVKTGRSDCKMINHYISIMIKSDKTAAYEEGKHGSTDVKRESVRLF